MCLACCGRSLSSWLLYAGNMALKKSGVCFQYNHMDTGCSHLASPYYLTAKAWILAIFLFPNNMILNRQFVCRYEKVFPGVVRHSSDGHPCHCIVDVPNLLDSIIVTAYPAL